MQDFANKKFRNRFTSSMYIDKYLEELSEGEVDMMASMGIEVSPRDENDVFVPIDKNTPMNLEEVQHTMNKAYGLKI